MGFTEYDSGTSFPGVTGRTADESEPAWPRPVRAVEGSPNVMIVVLDHPGFGHLGCYGSPIATPNLDRHEAPFTTPSAFIPGALTCGADPGSAVTTAYPAPFPFTGTRHKVTVDLSGELIQDKASELRVAMARQ